MVRYNPLNPEFSKVPTINIHSTQRKYINFNQPLSKVFQTLQRKNLLQPRKLKPLPNLLPPQIDPNLYCHFHQMPGHAIDTYRILKNVVLDLIDS